MSSRVIHAVAHLSRLHFFLRLNNIPSYGQYWTSQVTLVVKHLPANAGDVRDWIRFLDQKNALEKEMATHSSIFAWEIPWTEESSRLQSTGLQRVGHDWASELMDMLHIVYSFLRWGTLGLLPPHGNCEESCYEYLAHVLWRKNTSRILKSSTTSMLRPYFPQAAPTRDWAGQGHWGRPCPGGLELLWNKQMSPVTGSDPSELPCSLIRFHIGTSLVVQSLRLGSCTARGVSLIPGEETKIPYAACWSVDRLFATPRTQYARPPCPSPSLGVCPSSCALHWWCHPATSSSDALFYCSQSLPVSGSFPMSQLFTSEDQNTGASASASVLPVNIQGGSPLRLTGLISLQSKGLSRVFSSITVWRH